MSIWYEELRDLGWTVKWSSPAARPGATLIESIIESSPSRFLCPPGVELTAQQKAQSDSSIFTTQIAFVK